MNNLFCKPSPSRNQWAVSLSYASALILSLEALHGNACEWLGLTADQSYMVSAGLAALCVLLGTLVLGRMVNKL